MISNAVNFCQGEYITAAEHNLYSNLIPALMSWAKMRKKGDLCSTLGFCNDCWQGVTASASLPRGLCLSFVLPPSATAPSAQPGAFRLRFLFQQHCKHPMALDKPSAASFQVSCSDSCPAPREAGEEQG